MTWLIWELAGARWESKTYLGGGYGMGGGRGNGRSYGPDAELNYPYRGYYKYQYGNGREFFYGG